MKQSAHTDEATTLPAIYDQLAVRKRIANAALAVTQTLFAFGQLIGNNDMHFGNVGLAVEPPQVDARGRFTLAPSYDMLPMRFASGRIVIWSTRRLTWI